MGDGNSAATPGRPKKVKIDELPVLPGWISVPAAAADASLTRQRMSQLVEDGQFPTAHRIDGTPGTRPALVVFRTADFTDWKKRTGRLEEPAQA